MYVQSFPAFFPIKLKWVACFGLIALVGSNYQLLPATNQVTEDAALAVMERGPHHKIWRQIVKMTNEFGRVTLHTNSFTEMASGMHQWRNGKWVDADDTIQLTADGSAAFATNSQHQVGFGANIHVAGAIDLLTPHGQHLRSTVLGLSFDDPSTGKNAIIAQTQDSIGQLLPNARQIIYTNALVDSGSSFFADVLYTHKRNSFEQDIILREQPPSPSQYGLNPATTRLQVWTEFFNPPEPAVTTNSRSVQMDDGSEQTLGDEKLAFLTMEMGHGNAFVGGGATNAAETAANGMLLVPVVKHWVHDQGRIFLVEEVPLRAIISQLSALPPPTASSTNAPANPSSPQAFFRSMPTEGQQARMNHAPMRLAQANVNNHAGFTVDYNLINSTLTNFTFQSDTTYYMSGTCDFYGTTTLEGGTVVKCYTNNEAAVIMNGNVNCLTAPYRPAIFTVTNDNTVGVALSPSNNPTISVSTYLAVLQGGSLSNVRFSYAWNAISASGTNVDISDCQFVNCSHPITVNTGTTHLGLHNVLITMSDSINNSTNFCSCPASALTIYSQAIHCYAEHLTADLGSQNFITYFTTLGSTNNTTVVLTNCIMLTPHLNPMYSWGSMVGYTVGTNFTYWSSSNPGNIFQRVGAGNYYLSTNSACRAIGTSNLTPATLTDIQKKTTFAPQILSNTFTQPSILSPAVARDTASTPDLGYHYDPIDYLSSYCLVSNTTLLLTNGVVLGYYNNSGLMLTNAASLVSQGSPTQPDVIVHYRLVQEEATNLNTGFSDQSAIYNSLPFNSISTSADTANSISLRFTVLSLPIAGAFAISSSDTSRTLNNLRLQDCEIYASGETFNMDYYSAINTIVLKNNLFHRPSQFWLDTMGSIMAENNLFLGVSAAYLYNNGSGTSPNTSLNNAFDGCDVYLDGTYTKNAYLNGTTWEMAETSPIVTNLSWATGPLGNFYQPVGSPLIDKGNTTADQLGFYEYTTETNQLKEANSTVDIGYHYVALGTDKQPASTMWLGLPDYQVDTNGDGDVALINWQMTYFGHIGLDPNAVPDANGMTLLQAFESGADFTKIGFSVLISNNHVNTSTIPATVQVSRGLAYYMAVLVDSTNYTGATWNTFTSSNLSANLGSTEGWHYVWVGLRALPPDSLPIWIGRRIKLDRTAPAIAVTCPSSTVSQSIIELTGYSPESLSQISYDLSNANGVVTNQQVLVLNESYSTNSWEFTTNFFQAFDVGLVAGTNAFTLHATDLAGNLTSTNFNIILVSDTNAPVLGLVWPQDGMQLCGTNFTVFGTVDDISATISGTLVDANGDTNAFNALIERNGQFWVENLPLAAGTNWLSLSAVDPWGNTTTTNFTVTQSSLGLTIGFIDTAQLYKPTINVTGTISDASYGVWVNGVQGVNNGDGTWAAAGVPINHGGTARFAVSAYPPGDSVSTNTANPQVNPPEPNSANNSTSVDKPSRIYVESFSGTCTDNFFDIGVVDGTVVSQDNFSRMDNSSWSDGGGGSTSANQQWTSVLDGVLLC